MTKIGVVRQVKGKTSYVNRFSAFSSLEWMEVKQYRKQITRLLLVKAVAGKNWPVQLHALLIRLVLNYRNLVLTDDIPLAIRRAPIFITVDDFSDQQCYMTFTFRKPDIIRLHHCLKLDELGECVHMSNGSRFGTQELLLIFLHRLVYPMKFGEMVVHYKRDWSALCRAFNWVSKYIRNRFEHLLTSQLDYWQHDFEYFSECIRLKVIEKSEGGIIYPEGGYCVAFFYDDTMERMCRPGGGPAEEGENAPRFNSLIQGAFYSGKYCSFN